VSSRALPSLETASAEAAAAAPVERLYREHVAFVWRNARRLGCSDDWVDDAVQEVFLVAARRLPELHATANVRGWLFAILYRIVQRLKRDRSRYRARVERFSEAQGQPSAPSPEGQSHAAHQLRELLQRLDDPKRVVLILIELEGMTSAEVAELLAVPPGTVDSRLRAARQQLQKLIAAQSACEGRVTP
jgi:RNA polymerase sigma-70 factor (ECF subfamily)